MKAPKVIKSIIDNTVERVRTGNWPLTIAEIATRTGVVTEAVSAVVFGAKSAVYYKGFVDDNIAHGYPQLAAGFRIVEQEAAMGAVGHAVAAGLFALSAAAVHAQRSRINRQSDLVATLTAENERLRRTMYGQIPAVIEGQNPITREQYVHELETTTVSTPHPRSGSLGE